MQQTDRAGFETLRVHLTDLSRSPFDPAAVALDLVAKGIIGDKSLTDARNSSVNANERRGEVVRAVQLNGKPHAFQTFIKVLQDSGAENSYICDQLIATYRSNGGVWGGAAVSASMQNPTAVSQYSSGMITRELKKLTVNSAIRELSEFGSSNWSQLGLSLDVPQRQLDVIATNVAGKPHGQGEALTSVLDHWLRNDLEASWEKLASAVEMSSGVVLANKIRISVGIAPSVAAAPVHQMTTLPPQPTNTQQQSPATPQPSTSTQTSSTAASKFAEKPSLDDLLLVADEYSIPDIVENSYRRFAGYILKDSDGKIVEELEKKHKDNAGEIVYDVLRRWVNGEGRDCTWKILISALKASGHKQEAEAIKQWLEQQ